MKRCCVLRETDASKINSKFCQKKKGRNHVNIINKYFLPCFHFLIRESCPFFFSFVFFLLLFFVCFFLSLFFLISINYLFFLFVKKKFVYTDRSCRLIEKNTICVCIHGVIVYLYMVFLFLVCVFSTSTLTPNGYIFATNLIFFIKN